MKLLHISDLHLDSPLRSLTSDDSRREERNLELMDTFEHALQFAAEQQVTGVLLAGDLFDHDHPSLTAINAVKDKIRRYDGLQFYYLRGNHEKDALTERFEVLPANLHLFSPTQWTEYELDPEGRIRLYGLELTKANCADAATNLQPKQDCFNIVMLHGQTEETFLANSDAEVIPLASYRNRGIDYMALGHVHKHMHDSLDPGCDWVYPGCLEGRGFDEPGAHGAVLLDIDEMTLCCDWTFVPLQNRRVWVEDLDCTDCLTTGEIEERMEAYLLSAGISNRDMVRFILCGELVPEADLNEEQILHAYEDRFYAFSIKDKTGVQIDPTRYEHDMSLRGEFVRGVLARTDLSQEDKNAILSMGLRLMRGEKV